MTEPLWGVGSTAPYGHDGRSIDLWSVIMRHGGEAKTARDQFADLPEVKQGQIIDFLQTLVLFPPDDTASNLINPGDPATPDFPQYGHGNIALAVLFNDPTDLEYYTRVLRGSSKPSLSGFNPSFSRAGKKEDTLKNPERLVVFDGLPSSEYFPRMNQKQAIAIKGVFMK